MVKVLMEQQAGRGDRRGKDTRPSHNNTLRGALVPGSQPGRQKWIRMARPGRGPCGSVEEAGLETENYKGAQ